MISFDVGSLEKAKKLVESARIFALAESLGGVESLDRSSGYHDACQHSKGKE